MQYAAYKFPRIYLPRTRLNKLPVMRRNPAGGIMLVLPIPLKKARVGKEEILCRPK